MIGNGTIAAAPDDVPILNDHSADGHLTQRFCAPGFAQGLLHEEFVGVGHKKAASN
jgi:hypothetical protein